MNTEKKYSIEKIDNNMNKNQVEDLTMKWYSPMGYPFRLSGFPWISKDRVYRRLPLNPAYKIREKVDILANSSAGGQIGFRTDSKRLSIKVQLLGAASMDHMPATGQCGFDCYIGKPGNMLYCSTTRFDHFQSSYEYLLFEVEERKMRNITLNFPLYKGVKEVLIGLDNNSKVETALQYSLDKSVIFYGTSITQGGCASRPGMAYTNIISRYLNVECINLGFSDNGKGEPEMAHLIAEIENPACIVLDYDGNAGMALLEKTLPDFICILRETHRNVPILVVSRTRFDRENFNRERLETRQYLYNYQRTLVEKLQNEGDKHIHFYDGSKLLGDDFYECTVDGVHPTDLGFYRIANGLKPVLAGLIGF